MNDSPIPPNFYAIIPATVRYCKNLEAGAKLLYGEITALCSQEGFCWASNKYLASLYDVDVKTIQRWLISLKNEKFIAMEVEKKGFQTSRRIWLSPEIKKDFKKRQKCPAGETKMSPRGDKNVSYINTYNITSNKNPPLSPKGEECEMVSLSEKITLKKSEHEQLIKEYGEQTIKAISAEMHDYLCAHGKKYKDYAAAIRNWIRKRKENPIQKKIDIQQSNFEIAKQLEQAYPKEFQAAKEALVILGGAQHSEIKYTEHGFKERLANGFRKLGRPVPSFLI